MTLALHGQSLANSRWIMRGAPLGYGDQVKSSHQESKQSLPLILYELPLVAELIRFPWVASDLLPGITIDPQRLLPTPI